VTSLRCDLNADVGEADDDDGVAVERGLLDYVTSVHVACGGHAGDADSMRATVSAAVARGVRVGAHPSYPDRQGFGRRAMELAASDLEAALVEQLTALVVLTEACGTAVHTVKAHGALYGEVAKGETAYDVFLSSVDRSCGPGTALVFGAGSPAVATARRQGRTVLEEGFCDRAYRVDGGLVDRSQPGAVYDDGATAAAQALDLVCRSTVQPRGGPTLTLPVDTLCLHGDSPGALAMAAAVRRALEGADVQVVAAEIPVS
jgi:5-oxoprolinase (ATP-hydrolysing) subunit A